MTVRWNSTLIMIRRLYEQREAIDRVAFDKRQFEWTLVGGEWELLQPLINLLTPVEEASLLFCKSSLSSQIPFSKALINTLSKIDLRVARNEDGTEVDQVAILEIEEVRNKLVDGIKKRFLCLENERYRNSKYYFIYNQYQVACYFHVYRSQI